MPAKKKSLAKAKKPAVQRRKTSANDVIVTLESKMEETNGGGSVESVPGFDIFRAVTSGFDPKPVLAPSILAARADGGFFSTGAPRPTVPAAKPENIIGADNRVVVPDTATMPWRCICHLEVEYDRGPVGYGTGFLISQTAVITAAHVLVDRVSEGWDKPRKAARVRVIPGRNGTLAPYGYFVSSDFRISTQWDLGKAASKTQRDAAEHDYAAIMIPKTMEVQGVPYGERLGYFGLKVFSSEEAEGSKMLFVNNAGYPYEADKPYGTLWYNAGRVSKMDEHFIDYMLDTVGGQSGSPIYVYDEKLKQRYVLAIHTTGDFVNRGLRITRSIFDTLCNWAARSPREA